MFNRITRVFASWFQALPPLGTEFKHRDIDLYLLVIEHQQRSPVIQYCDKSGVPLEGRSKRVMSLAQLHMSYDEAED